MNRDYTHELHNEVRSISGGYTLHEEGTVEFEGRDVLYAVGDAIADSACCGMYGCRFAYVPGYVVDWKYRTNDEGLPVSKVEPVRDQSARGSLTAVLQEKLGVAQVQFG
ncbi:MAG: hypothetical protein RDU20_15165 [Desulfomonilaceae bacterium]|nr:hypothetical protein [Desulfomonilaceae bacterium]